MYKIDLSEYKTQAPYFRFFDIHLKKDSINKEARLKQLGIAPSSYRRSRNSRTKIGEKLIADLAQVYSIKMLSCEEIDEIEELLNNIYLDVYFKISDNFETYLNKLNKYIEDNVILKPVLWLFIIFIRANEYRNPSSVIAEMRDSFKQINEYKDFFNEGLKEIFIIISIIFEKSLDNIKVEVNYQSALIYCLLASKFCLNGKYFNSLYCATKAREILIRENNFKRIINLNMVILSDYNSIKNYNDAIDLALEQMRVLKSFNYENQELQGCYSHYFIALLGIGEYKRICIEQKEIVNTTSAIIKLVATYFAEPTKFEDTYRTFVENKELEPRIINQIYGIILNKDKKTNLLEFSKTPVRSALKEIIFNLFEKRAEKVNFSKK